MCQGLNSNQKLVTVTLSKSYIKAKSWEVCGTRAFSNAILNITHPEYLLFVDETGCNENQLNDGKVGEELYITSYQKMWVMLQHQQ
jgi:hypothetical protein